MDKAVKTAKEIEDLKHNWFGDPVWDIEKTEGFEDHEAELLAYRKECESRGSGERYLRLSRKAVELGVPENINLAAYIDRLEERIKALEGVKMKEAGR